MKKLFILSLLLVSCKSVEKDIKEETNKSEQTIETYKKDSIQRLINETNFSISPIDLEKPFFVNGKEYKNVTINNYTKQTKEDIKSEETKKENNKYFIVTREKQVERKPDYTWIIYLGFIFAIIILIIVWYFNKQIKNLKL